MLVLLMGPPGVGKGKQLFLLQNALKNAEIEYKNFIFGDEFRRLAKDDEVISRKISNGDLIDDDNVNRIFDMLSISPDNRGLKILDGYPRSIGQAKHLLKYSNIVPIFFYTTFEVLKYRLLRRKQCKDCNFCVLDDKVVCEKCGSKNLLTRSDDNISAIQHRFEEYERVTKPVKDYFSTNEFYLQIEANNNPNLIHDMVYAHIVNILKSVK